MDLSTSEALAAHCLIPSLRDVTPTGELFLSLHGPYSAVSGSFSLQVE